MISKINLIGLLLCLIASGCKDQPVAVDRISIIHQWKVISLSINDISVGKPQRTYLMDFYTDKNISLKLEANGCGAIYNLLENGEIRLPEGLGCTKVCCDSNFSVNLTHVISDLDHYTLNGDTLTLWSKGIIGVGKIKLVKN